MSPLSIAQYLSAETSNFDIVIFDEASQIPVWDAIGAMARARQVVMVGDPKQLPPTSFFGRADTSDTFDEDTQGDRKSTRLNSSHLVISYAVFCLKKKTTGTFRLIVTRADGSGALVITPTAAASIAHVSFSPDGSQIVYTVPFNGYTKL